MNDNTAMRKKISSESVFYLIAAIISILFTLIYTFSPLEADDYWFLEGTQGMSHGWKMFLVACDTMKERWLTDTGRLGNIINPLFLALFPKWVFNIVSGVAVYFILVFGCRLASASPGSLRSYLLISLIIFCYPWYDYLFCITFGINYVWSIALALITSGFLLQTDHHNRISLILISLLCFITGWIHEGLGIPLACGGVVVAVMLFKNHSLSGQYLLKLACLCAGCTMICFSPVFWNRAETAVSNIYKFPLKEMIMQIGPGVAMFFLFIGFLIIVLSKRIYRKNLINSPQGLGKTFFFFTVILVSLVVMIKYYNGPRTGAGVVMFASVGTVWLSSFLKLKISGFIKNIISAILTSAILINLISAVCIQKKLLREYKDIVTLFTDSSDGSFYYDLTYPKADLSLYKTTVRQFHERIPKYQLGEYLDGNKTMVILPTALEGLNANNTKPASQPGFYTFNGYIVMDPDVDLDSPRISVKTADGTVMSTRYRRDTFHDSGGREWVMIMPHVQTLDEDLRITDILP